MATEWINRELVSFPTKKNPKGEPIEKVVVSAKLGVSLDRITRGGDMRVYYLAPDGKWLPTKKGVWIPYQQIGETAKALTGLAEFIDLEVKKLETTGV